MKAIRIILLAGGLLVVLAVGAVAVLVNLVDPNDYKPEIAALVKKNTGRDLHLRGDIELAFFPWLGVKTGRFELSDREGFGPAPMLMAEEADIKIKLIPLLKKRVEVDTVLLNKPQINLARRADGAANWDDLAARVRGRDGGFGGGRSPSDAALLAGLAVQGIAIADGRVGWDDRAAGHALTLTALNLDTGKLTPGEPVDFALSTEIEGSALPEPAAVTLTTTARLSENLESISLARTELRVGTESITANLSMETMSYALRAGLAALTGLKGDASRDAGGKPVTASLEIPSLAFNQSDESLQLPRFELEQGDFMLTGKMNGSALLSAPGIGGALRLRAGDMADLLQRNGFATDFFTFAGLVDLRVEEVDASLNFTFANEIAGVEDLSAELLLNRQPAALSLEDLSLDLADGTLELSAVRLTQGNFSVSGAVEGAGVMSGGSATAFSGSVDARIGDVAELLARNNLALYLPPSLANSVAAKFNFDLADNALTLTNLALESIEGQNRQSLSGRDAITFPLKAVSALDLSGFTPVLRALLKARAERELKQQLPE